MAVDPLRSEKTIVTVFRVSGAGSCVARGVPQNPHRRNLSGFSSPQLGQICIETSVGPVPAIVYAGLLGLRGPEPEERLVDLARGRGCSLGAEAAVLDHDH